MATRHERVVLSLQDDFSSGMARAAAATALLDKRLDLLDGSTVRSTRSLAQSSVETDRFARTSRTAGAEIDKLSGRMRIFADAAAVLGPSLVPVGAVAVPAIAGLANQFGFAAIAAGTAVIAFQGVGDALTAVNKASIEPTTENLQAARDAMETLSPAARDMVRELQSMRPLLADLRDTAAEGMFPGLIEGLESLQRLAPSLDSILGNVSSALGDIFAAGADSLAGDRWADFFAMIAAEARPTMTDMASAIGSVVHGLSELWEAFAPLNRDFGSWLADAASGFDEWAEGLSQTAGFQEFVDYIRTNGPQVADAAAAIGGALVQIVQAVAPLGGPSLQIIESFAKALGAIADSDIGTPLFAGVAALALLNRTMAVTAALQTRMGAGFAAMGAGSLLGTLRTDLAVLGPAYANAATKGERLAVAGKSIARNLGPAALAVGGLAVATSGLGDDFGVTNTASLAMMGTLAGPWGAAIGGGIGLALDFAAANDDVTESMKQLNAVASSGAGFAQMSAGLQQAKADLSAFQSQVDLSNPDLVTLNPFANLGDKMAATKNWAEGLFGDSDVEEAQAQFDAAAAAIANTEATARALAAAMSVPIFGSQTAQLQQLDQVVRQATPAMAALGVTFQDVVAAQQQQNLGDLANRLGFDVPTGQLDALTGAIRRTSDAMSATPLEKLRSGAHLTAAEIRGLTDAMLANRNAAIGNFDAITAYRQALKDARGLAADNNAGINGSTKAALDNRNALSSLAGAWNNQSAAVRNNIEKFREARTNFLDVAQAMGVPIKQALRLADSLFALPEKTHIGLEAQDRATAKIVAIQRLVDYYGLTRAEAKALLADLASGKVKNVQQLVDKYGLTKAEARALLNDAASGKLQGLLTLLDRANGYHAQSSTTHTITTVLRTVRDAGDTAGGPPALRGVSADGTTVPKTGLPYADRHLYLLADGEEVVSNRHGQADRHRSLLKAINANRLAGGGTAGDLPPFHSFRSGDNPTERESRRTGEALKGLRGELKRATSALEKERKQRDALTEKMKSTASDVSSGLRTDLFGEHDVWSGDASPLGILRGDLADAKAMRAAIKELRSKGLTGPALAEVLAQGGLEGALAFKEMSRRELREYSQLFNQRNRLLQNVGQLAGNASFGAQRRESSQDVRELKREVTHIKNLLARGNKDRKDEHQKDRNNNRRGAGNSQRNKRRD